MPATEATAPPPLSDAPQGARSNKDAKEASNCTWQRGLEATRSGEAVELHEFTSGSRGLVTAGHQICFG